MAALDAVTLDDAAGARDTRSVRVLCLEAELADREGRHWELQWKLLGDGSESSPTAGEDAWRASVMLTTPGGQVHERSFARGAGLVGSLAAASDDWEWRSQGASLLPAKLRFDVGGREVILLLEALETRVTDDAQAVPLVRVRGFVNLGLEKTYLSGRGQLQQDWRQLAGQTSTHPRRELVPLRSGGE